MAIQFRRGQHNKFDKTKMLAGEPAVVLGGDPDTADGKALYVAFAQGDATRMARADEIPGEASQSAAGLMSAGDKAKLDGVAAGANAYVHPSYTARTGKPTGNQTPAFGGTFPVSQIVTDAQGHVTAATDRTVKIPDTEASQSVHGLMSAADKRALDAIKVTSGNRLHRALTAPVVTASDAYAAPPVALCVQGKSTQDGTPTPDAPVEIESVGPDADGGVKLVAQRTSDTSQSVTTTIPLQGHALRSLPDGTHDELRVDADGNVTLVQKVGHVTIDGTTVAVTNRSSPQSPATAYRAVVPLPDGEAITAARRSNMRSDKFRYDADALTLSAMQTGMASLYQYTNRPCILCVLTDATVEVEQMNAWFATNPTEVDYPLAEPVEIPLGYVPLPSMPAPDLTAWASCTPATELELDYERDVSLVIAALEAQIAEIATA